MKLERLPEITEFAATVIDLDTGEIAESLSMLIKPSQTIPKKNEEITGITNEMVSTSPPFSAFSNLIRGLIETSDAVVAHNARFDVDMCDIEFERLGIQLKWPEIVCSIEATRHLVGGKSLNLGALHELLFGRKHEGAHRAAGDVEAMVSCLVKLRATGDFPYGPRRA
jgi:DNA polymerase III epsilon subunit-like protein